jgi:hypothetical protein
MKLFDIIKLVAPSFESVRQEVEELQRSYPKKSNDELAQIFGNRQRNKYTSYGIASSLPSALPGIGTAIQLSVDIGAVSTDFALMLRWMAASCYGISYIYDKDIENEFSQEFVKVLGMWCGVIKAAKDVAKRLMPKIAEKQFNRHVTGKMLQKINRIVGTTLFTKYGVKRGGIALGRLIPFGVGALISGTFNYATLQKFNNAAVAYFRSEGSGFIIIE